MVPLPFPTRPFDSLVRERAVVIRNEAAQQTGFVRVQATGVPVPSARGQWREQQARQQRYEALVCESLAELWLEGVPQVRERARRENSPES
ncbi:MAG: hypothetical protein JWO85_1538 [Candidatus Eremiobacteraeota bacterium]|jgi:hypothetical protein|nr:hypothetical protein [Candidatus Eremiobacteraeota bacterium]